MTMVNELGSDWAFQRCTEFYIKLASTALLLALVAAWAFFFRRRKLRLPPGPFPFPIIGNLHMMGELPHKALAALSLKYGPLLSLRLGSALTLVVSSPDMAKEFLKAHDLLFASRPSSIATKYLWYNSSDITFSPYGRYWRQMRKICVLQLLSSRRIESFRLVREEEVSAMIRAINSDAKGYLPVNITKAVLTLGIDIISRIAFGRKYSDQHLMGSTGIHSMIKETFFLAGFLDAGFLDAKVENFEWIPFGAGRRGCPGQQLGMIVVEFAVAQLLHCFNWRLPDDMNEQKLDMSEKNHGLTVSRAHELFAVPTPRLPVL